MRMSELKREKTTRKRPGLTKVSGSAQELDGEQCRVTVRLNRKEYVNEQSDVELMLSDVRVRTADVVACSR